MFFSKEHRPILIVGVIFLLLYSFCVAGVAQDARGKILGLITDGTGGVIPAATVTVRHLEMNTSSTVVSNAAGNYELPYLLPGIYRLEVEVSGFKKYIREPIEVRVGDSISLPITLEVGSASEIVTVTAEAPLLESSNAGMSSVMEHKLLEDLPLAGGDVMYMARFSTGVTSAQAPGHNWLPSATDVMSNITVGGTRSGSSEFSLDGIPNMTGSSVSFAPPPDAVQEFRVQVASYDASVGHASGANVNMSMKSGTNKLHGTANWDYAAPSLQAVDFFTNGQLWNPATGPVTEEKKAAMLPPRKVSRYSATVGGPVVLPHLYNGRSKTFWMYALQGFNRKQRNNDFLTVPTEAQRNGDFSALLAVNKSYQIYDPATTRPATAGRLSRQPFDGNKIPSNRIDPMAKKLLTYYPMPNAAGTVDGRNNFNVVSANNNDFYQNMGRVDHEFSEKHRMFVRVTQSWLHFYRNNFFQNEARGLSRYRKQRGLGFDDVYVLSPTMVLNSRYGFTRFIQTDQPESIGFDLASLGFPAGLVSQLDKSAAAFPMISFDQYTTLGESTNTLTATNYHNFGSTLSWTRGNHSIRMGGEFRVQQGNGYNYANASPNESFSTTYTRGPLDNSTASPIGQDMASFLLGIPTGGGLDNNASYAIQSKFFGLFIQDDWKVSRKLTANIGLRWEHDSPITERFDRAVGAYDFTTANPIQSTARANYATSPIPEVPVDQFRTMGGPTFAGRNGNARSTFETSSRNFAPRVGFAYQLNSRMVLRAGYGIFFSPVGADQIGVNQAGFSMRTNLISSNDNGQTYIASLANPFPSGLQKPSEVGLTTYLGRAVTASPEHRPNPYMQRWSFSIQREFPRRILLEVGYLGNRGTRLEIIRQLNYVPAPYLSKSAERDQTTIDHLTYKVKNPFYGMKEFEGSGLTAQTINRSSLLLPYPHFTSLLKSQPVGYTWYHALLARVEKRFGNGIAVNGSYTWSKMMEAMSFLNESDTRPEKVIGAQDRAHRITVATVYELPFGRGRLLGGNMNRVLDAVLGGWQLQAIYQGQSGPPLAFGNIIYRGNLHDIVLPAGERSISRWFNTGAPFEKDSTKQLGSNIRTFPSRLSGLRGPGDNYWDMSLSKTLEITEGLKLQVRTQWEGAMNHPQFSTPNMVPTNTLFGTITGIVGEARRIYIGAKLLF